MMITEKLDHSRIKATFDVTKEEFETALDYSFKKNNASEIVCAFINIKSSIYAPFRNCSYHLF